MTKLDSFIAENRADMLADMRRIVARARENMAVSPEDYTERGADGPSIDVRLCIDIDSTLYRREGWIIRTGSVDFDPVHSQFCAAGCIGLGDDTPEDILDYLIRQLD